VLALGADDPGPGFDLPFQVLVKIRRGGWGMGLGVSHGLMAS